MVLSSCDVRMDQNGRELIRHGTALFPVGCYRSLAEVAWHWHDELEVFIVMEGTALAAAGAERLTLSPGEGMFINAGVLHGAWRQAGARLRFHSLVFHPRLVGGGMDSVFWQNYVQPLLDGPKSVRLTGGRDWDALAAIAQAWQSCAAETPGYEFQVRDALSRLVFLLSRFRLTEARQPTEKELRDGERLKRMLQFIQERYDQELTTAQIAASALISESECLRCFRGTIGTPPIQYLKQLRLQKAASLLRSTPWPVGEVGARCGFQDASYFSKSFREAHGCTPAAYRARHTPAGEA